MSEEKLKVLLLSHNDLDVWNNIFDYLYESERKHYFECLDEDEDFIKEDHIFYWIHQMEDWFSQVNYKTKKFYDYELIVNDDIYRKMFPNDKSVTDKLESKIKRLSNE